MAVQGLNLQNEDDELEIELEEGEPEVQKVSFRLVGRFLTNRPIRVKVMMDKMGEIWQPGRGMAIEEAYPGIFVFKFFHQLDVQRILKQGPWSFDNHTLILNDDPDAKRERGPDLRADMGRKQSGGTSKWLRDEGDSNWVAPNPVFMSNQCSNSQGENKGANNGEMNDTTKKDKGENNGMAELFRNPHILFPKQTNDIKNGINHEQIMEEDVKEELLLEGDRKRSRNQAVNEKTNVHMRENTGNTSQPHVTEQHFLLAGPGEVRQG
ncbi:hypothetical protein A2U01_0004317 [Trifolium medium]|uniref:DUF4283 domain-containing protein n=1 Tax=Trifolium medium TaxID=97028 RepID=A0A392MB87_9FABA|nr:hypothetical protein [Trifolium medium]